ncbi:MAG: 2-C-methyl-D-erythritol 4-phosphate cytidylyltransferase [Actinomycetota bacterium]
MIATRFVTAVLLAAGKGERMEGAQAKQFADLGGEQMFFRPLRTLIGSEYVDHVVLVLPSTGPPSPVPIENMGFAKIRAYVEGGASRQDSLSRGLKACPKATGIVLVHDAARPLVPLWLVDRVLESLDDSCDGVIPVIPLPDAAKELSPEKMVTASIERKNIWRAQTPQASVFSALTKAVEAAEESGLEGEDCSQLLIAAGYRVRAIEGDQLNFKITRREDLEMARAVIAGRPPVRSRRRTAFPHIWHHRR